MLLKKIFKIKILHFKKMSNLVDDKFGYVEDVEHEDEYKNIDYRDTIVPLWKTLRKNKKEGLDGIQQNGELWYDQDDINLALCASIIQLGNCVKENTIYLNKTFRKIKDKLEDLEKKIDKITLENKSSTPVENS